MRRTSWKLAGLLLAFALVAMACGDDDAGPADVPGLVENGKLIVATTGNFPPFTAIDESTGDNIGYSIDIVREIAKRLDLELELPTVDFVAELEGLASGLFDIADSGI